MRKPKILTNAQARELKFFCQNVIGVRQDMYETIEKTQAFDERIKRLEKTCMLIEKFLGEELKPFGTFFGQPLAHENKGDK